MLLILGGVSRDRLRNDLLRDPVVVNIGVTIRASRNFVPSTATTPDLTSPAFAHNRRTEVNSSASRC